MECYFKGTAQFLEEGADKPTTKNFMVDAITFMDAEINLTKYMNDFEDIEQFVIKTFSRVAFDEVLFLKEMEEFDWYVSNVKMAIDGGKEISFKILIAGESMKDVTEQLTLHLLDSDGECRITKTSIEPIADIVLSKSCDILGNMVVSFLDQRTIDLKLIDFEQIQKENEAEMKRLGAIHLTARKYKLELRDKPENFDKLLDKITGQRVVKTWKEYFIDEDSGDVVSIERSEIIFPIRTYIDKDVLQEIIDANPETITLFR